MELRDAMTRLSSPEAAFEHTAQRVDRGGERVLGGCAEAHHHTVAGRYLGTGQRMSQPRESGQRHSGFTRPAQHQRFGSIRKRQQHVQSQVPAP